ncbi:ATP-binding cassette subfamily B protein [Rhizobium leguminosarum]|uniref:ATP-binding cassette subfamily B protein n=1 Tax=Rhizobium leguminosarum TaxID=384 RepID=A0AAE2T0A7_RHILE|nr:MULTISPECIES: ABC transporter ATP-binding protein [Rhizobium]MBB4293413.1 ATP-binding cassette subfamily B protein [Rhizobium leguminosarum]MBB4295976.1 ATP-binding cassette subfamily B protein [Rhizobium leguminosarum]MBB4311325.1 ATP-binding cassette subfamily B protein [Rhizobium leguminosarum]MBB4420201.1 ATP-binding cassette subfamily B protein [Rhizobium leguminosarum]MBB4435631.1 ATP-binding cassette subfamily B protein [Rhizobium esperanzae]
MEAAESRTQSVSSDTVTGILKRIIAENGRDHLWGYVFAIVCLIVVALSTAFTAWIMRAIIDEAFANRRADVVWIICLSIFIAFVLRGFASYGQAVALSKVGNNIVARYQRRLYSHLMTLSVGFFSEARSAHIAAQVSQNVSGIRDVLNLTITSTVRDLLTFISLLGVMILQDPLLSLAVFIMAPPLLYALRYVSKRLRSATREAVHLNSHVLGAMQETIQGIAIVKAFTMEEELERKVNKLITGAENRANRIARLSERTSPLTESFAGFAVASVLAYAAYRSIYYNVPPGAFFSFVTALLLAYDPARRLARLQVQMERAVVNARMIYELLDMEPRQRDLPDAKPLAVTQARIEFRNVSFAYGNESVLSGVSFIAEGGATTALVGPSGAGKSTVISLIPRFYDPREGEILIDGQDIAHITKKSLRQQLAYVSQQPYLFEGTIRDNIRYGRPEATDAEVEEAARLAYAHDFISAQPQGYETAVGENGVTLSGGQRQRLSIARALVRNAPILLLDEATSALDTESEAAVQKALDEAMTGRTVVVIAHRLSTVVRADKIVVMQQGRVVEQGNHETLAKVSDGLYARLNNLQRPSASDSH